MTLYGCDRACHRLSTSRDKSDTEASTSTKPIVLGGLCGQVQGFVWSSAWVCVHHVFSYLWAYGQVGGFVLFFAHQSGGGARMDRRKASSGRQPPIEAAWVNLLQEQKSKWNWRRWGQHGPMPDRFCLRKKRIKGRNGTQPHKLRCTGTSL